MGDAILDIVWACNFIGFSCDDLRKWRQLSRKSQRMVCHAYLNTPKPVHDAVGEWFTFVQCSHIPSILEYTDSLLGGTAVYGYVAGHQWEGMTLEWHTSDNNLPHVMLWLSMCGYRRARDDYSLLDQGDATFDEYEHRPRCGDKDFESPQASDSEQSTDSSHSRYEGSATRWIKGGRTIIVHNFDEGALISLLKTGSSVTSMSFMSHTSFYDIHNKWTAARKIPIFKAKTSDVERRLLDSGWDVCATSPSPLLSTLCRRLSPIPAVFGAGNHHRVRDQSIAALEHTASLLVADFHRFAAGNDQRMRDQSITALEHTTQPPLWTYPARFGAKTTAKRPPRFARMSTTNLLETTSIVRSQMLDQFADLTFLHPRL
ncbi:hypothetical protein CYLTODRAFT_458268 [Cylindrobasidium torrendii FP15055 ss-10]|uniref:Uncharacterized protein n=1 Tax=Cylindrobasidium torrendii FP15055 ss-10 TaxID=1314674 RepID=A0A0D7AZE6_9AGAR|nr:hypothetical protein CYLTODRAFT_458268 [Cylindrobasidium torrendii FP15055 ss-10]